MATPTLRAIRRRFPGAQIAWMGGPAALDTLAGLNWSDDLLEDASRSGGAREAMHTIGGIRRGKYDLAVLLSNAFRVALLCRLGGVRERLGYDRDGRGFLLTDKVAPPRRPNSSFEPTPALRYYLALAERIGCDMSDPSMELAVEEEFAAEADALLASEARGDGPWITLNGGASFGASKLWPVERFSALADRLIERFGARIILNAGPAERDLANAIADGMAHEPAVNFGRHDNSLGLLKAIIARSRLVVTGDTGPRHIAAALGTPVVTLFGPTDPAWTTIDFAFERIVQVAVDCAPCQEKICPHKPDSEVYHQCMRRITVEQVEHVCCELLGSGSIK